MKYDPDLGVRLIGFIMSIWSTVVGLGMTAVPVDRFSSAQWKFVMMVPGDNVTVGALLFAFGLVALFGIFLGIKKMAVAGSMAAGAYCTVIATFLGLAALTEDTGGVLGSPLWGIVGLILFVYAALALRMPWPS